MALNSDVRPCVCRTEPRGIWGAMGSPPSYPGLALASVPRGHLPSGAGCSGVREGTTLCCEGCCCVAGVPCPSLGDSALWGGLGLLPPGLTPWVDVGQSPLTIEQGGGLLDGSWNLLQALLSSTLQVGEKMALPHCWHERTLQGGQANWGWGWCKGWTPSCS